MGGGPEANETWSEVSFVQKGRRRGWSFSLSTAILPQIHPHSSSTMPAMRTVISPVSKREGVPKSRGRPTAKRRGRRDSAAFPHALSSPHSSAILSLSGRDRKTIRRASRGPTLPLAVSGALQDQRVSRGKPNRSSSHLPPPPPRSSSPSLLLLPDFESARSLQIESRYLHDSICDPTSLKRDLVDLPSRSFSTRPSKQLSTSPRSHRQASSSRSESPRNLSPTRPS